MDQDEDEESIFDASGSTRLIGSDEESDYVVQEIHSSPPVPQIEAGRGAKIFITLCLCASFFGLGLCVAIFGPTLLDLQLQTHTDTEGISRLFIGRSAGYLVGSAVGGFLYDHFAPVGVIGVSLGLLGAGTLAIPWCPSVLSLSSVIAAQGAAMGLVDTGSNVMVLHIWSKESGPWMQSLHFAFGVGAFVAPLVAEPFLAPGNVTRDWNATSVAGGFHPAKRIHRDLTYLLPVEEQVETLVSDWDLLERNFYHGIFLNIVRKKRDGEISNKTSNEEPGGTNGIAHPITGNTENKDSSIANGKILKGIQDKVVDASNTVEQHSDKNNTGNITVVTINTTTTPTTTTVSTTVTTTTITTTTTTPLVTVTTIFENFTLVTDSPSNHKPTFVHRVTTTISDLSSQVSVALKNLSMIQFAYEVVAVYILLVAVLFTCVCCWLGCRPLHVQYNTQKHTQNRSSKGFRVQLLALLFCFFFLYVGLEVTFGGLLMTFVVESLGWTKTEGTMVTATFWASFAAGRGLAIPLSKFLSPPAMLIIDLLVTNVALVGLAFFLSTSPGMLWFLAALLGIGMASIYPSGITWAERYMSITGQATSLMVVGSAAGEMCIPAFAGFMFETKGPSSLMYILFGSALFAIVLYIVMQNLASNSGKLVAYSYVDARKRYNMEVAHNADNAPLLNRPSDSDYENGDLGWHQNKHFFEDLHVKMKKKVTFNFQNNQTHNSS